MDASMTWMSCQDTLGAYGKGFGLHLSQHGFQKLVFARCGNSRLHKRRTNTAAAAYVAQPGKPGLLNEVISAASCCFHRYSMLLFLHLPSFHTCANPMCYH